MRRLRVGILGATGVVGQHYIQALQGHPFFEVTFLAASQKSAGLSYRCALGSKGRACDSVTSVVMDLPVFGIDQIDIAGEQCDFVFSAVSSEIAATYEKLYAAAGLPVVSNASHHRMDPDVPLLIPEINPDHLQIIPHQQRVRGWDRGFIVAKPNCSLQSYLIPLFPLHRAFGIKRLILTTMQAVSGAGYPGVSSLDIVDNLIPYIHGEEEKSEREPLKILGKVADGKIAPAEGISISAHCNRVSVIDGHTACLSVEFNQRPTWQEIVSLWREFRGVPQELALPSAPAQPILYREERDRPQPRLDRDSGGGMAVSIGRLRECEVFDYRFVALSHNAMRGAAKGGVLNSELLYTQGYLGEIL
jgi:aspartate-semialdehyde dehydrogenase